MLSADSQNTVVVGMGWGTKPPQLYPPNALYTPEAIVIGSDSKIVALNGSDTSCGCKIHVAGRFAWASAGLLAETRGPFDLRGIVKAAPDGMVSFREAAQRLKRFIDARYQHFRERSIQGGVSAEMAYTDLLLAGVGADQILHVLVTRFGRTAPTTDCPSAKCPEFGFLELGEHARIDDILYGPHGQVHTISRSKCVPEAIAYLIAAQERATPKLVGGPISILGIDKSGPHWIVPGTCSALGKARASGRPKAGVQDLSRRPRMIGTTLSGGVFPTHTHR